MNIWVEAIASCLAITLYALFLFKFAGPALIDFAKVHAELKESRAKAWVNFQELVQNNTPPKDLTDLQDALLYIVAHGYTPEELRTIINQARKEGQ